MLADLVRIARLDIGNLFGPRGTMTPVHQLPREVRQTGASIEVRSGKRSLATRIKIADRLRAYELIARHIGMFKDRGEADEPPKLETWRLPTEELRVRVNLSKRMACIPYDATLEEVMAGKYT